MMDTFNPFQNGRQFSVFDNFLEGNQRGNYFSYANQFGQSPNQKQYYEAQFPKLMDQYTGYLAQQARNQMMPQGTFNDFLGGNESLGMKPYDWNQQYQMLPPSQRNDGSTQRFSPWVRWLGQNQ